MRFLISLLAFVVGVGATQAIQIRPRLVAGDEFRLEVTRTRDDRTRPAANFSARTVVDVRVISAGASGSVIDWRPGASAFEAQTAPDPGLVAQGKAIADVGVRIALSADGEYERLVNEDDVRPRIEAMRKLALGGLSEAERQKGGELLDQLLSPAALISVATRDAQIYCAINGLSAVVGETVEIPMKQATPIGVVPVVYRVRLDAATAETASITTTTTYDNEALTRLTIAALEKMGNKATPQEVAGIQLNFSDEARYLFDRQIGLMKELTLSRRQTGAGQERLDRWTIRLVSGPKRPPSSASRTSAGRHAASGDEIPRFTRSER